MAWYGDDDENDGAERAKDDDSEQLTDNLITMVLTWIKGSGDGDHCPVTRTKNKTREINTTTNKGRDK